MRSHEWVSTRVIKGIAVALVLAISGALIIIGTSSHAAAQAQGKLEATIFALEGQDFVRTHTTLTTEDGKSAVNTKLDRGTPAYKALMAKHSYTGEASVFGHNYAANYAPLTDKDGQLTGALFVAVSKQ